MSTSTPRTSKLRQERMSRRQMIDGRLVAVEVEDAYHGTRYIYISYGCRCVPCSEANAAYQREYEKNSAA